MPLIALARFALSLASLLVLSVAAYCLWSWHDGQWLVDARGRGVLVRENWRLWLGLALLAWSFLGRWAIVPMLARRDTDPARAKRKAGHFIQSPTGSRLYVEIDGAPDASPIILTHGWGLDGTIWFYLRRALANRYRVIVWDLAGLGRSRAAKGQAVDLEHFALDLKAVLALCEGEPAVLVGHSIGGMTIQTLVRDHAPDLDGKVAGVVLVNTTYTNPLRTMAAAPAAVALRWPLIEPLMRLAIWLQPLAWLSAWQGYLSGSAHLANRIGFARQVTRSQLEHTTLLATRNSPATQARGNLAMFRWDADGALQTLVTPTLILAGAGDLVTLPSASDVIRHATPGGHLETIEDANHMGFLERAKVYDALILAFCDEVLGPPFETQSASKTL